MAGPIDSHPELAELRATFDRVVRQELAAGARHVTGGMVSDQGGLVLSACLAARSPLRGITPVYGGIRVSLDDGSLDLRGVSWTNPTVQKLSPSRRRRPWRLDRLVLGDRSVQLFFARRRRTVVLSVDAVAQSAS